MSSFMLAYSAPSPRLITDLLAWTLPPLVALLEDEEEPRLVPAALAPPVNRRPRPEPDELAEEEGEGDDAVGAASTASSSRGDWGGGDAAS